MNKLFFSLILFAVFAFKVDAQMSDRFLNKMVQAINAQAGEGSVNTEMLSPLADKSKLKRERFNEAYMESDSLTGVVTMIADNLKGGFDTTVVDGSILVRKLNLPKLTGRKEHEGRMVYTYGYDPSMKDPRPQLIVSYKQKAKNTKPASTTSPANATTATIEVAGGEQGAVNGEAANFGGLTPGQIITDPNSGASYIVVADSEGNPSLMPINAMVPAGMQQAQIAPQGDGMSGKVDNTSPMRYSPEVKYFQDEEGKSVPYYIAPNGQIIRLTDPDAPKQIDVDGVTVVYAKNGEDVWQPTFTNKRNGYKFGVGEYAGYQGNYYRDAANGAPRGTGNVRGLGFVNVQPAGFAVGGCAPAGPVWYNQMMVNQQQYYGGGPRVACGNGQWSNYGPYWMNRNARRR